MGNRTMELDDNTDRPPSQDESGRKKGDKPQSPVKKIRRAGPAEPPAKKAGARSAALRASELSYWRLFESARDGILILDADTGQITDVNSFLIELLGFSRGEIIGRTVGELSPLEDLVSNRAMLERLQKEGYARYDDLPLETKDGRRIAV